MAQATLVPLPRMTDAFRFQSLVLTAPSSAAKQRGATLAVSLVLHSILILAVLIVPLYFYESLPAPGEGVRAFFVTPAEAAPPPPPPPPPAAGVRAAPRTPVVPQPEEPARFVAPMETPADVKPEEGISLAGVEGGVPGGVEGGVPGGVVGGIVGGLPQEAPPPPKAVRIGGHLKAPQILKQVNPVYPPLARDARIRAFVILEATVDPSGHVSSVTVLRGAPLFDEAAAEAVRQWVYRPLLLNGVPVPFVLTVTLNFSFKSPAATEGS
jgi:protein TonB